MRKYLLALAAGLLAASLAVPAPAADFKYTGFFRIRGITSDDLDRNKLTHDGAQYYDSLMRPRFTATSEGGKIVSVYELDFITGGNYVWGRETGRPGVGTNRWYFDFAVPGTTLRMKVGKDDYTDPTREIFDSVGAHRQHGIALYGKLFGPVDLSFFNTTILDNTTGATAGASRVGASDHDNYYLALKWQAAPQIAITPWAALNRRNTENAAGTTGLEAYFIALHTQAKVGIMDLVVQGILETGNAAQPTRTRRDAGDRDIDLEAWALMVRSWFTFGKLKIGLYVTMLTGDDDQVTATGNQAQQKDRQLTRFVFPSQDGAGYLEGPNILTGRRWSTITANNASGTNTTSNQRGIGAGTATSPNGLIMPEILLKYQLTPALLLEGGVSFVRSAKKAPDVGATLDGPSAAATTYDNSKNFGTAIEAGFRWSIYSQLRLNMVGSYLAAGDYGVVQGSGKAKDDAWAVYYELIHTW